MMMFLFFARTAIVFGTEEIQEILANLQYQGYTQRGHLGQGNELEESKKRMHDSERELSNGKQIECHDEQCMRGQSDINPLKNEVDKYSKQMKIWQKDKILSPVEEAVKIYTRTFDALLDKVKHNVTQCKKAAANTERHIRKVEDEQADIQKALERQIMMQRRKAIDAERTLLQKMKENYSRIMLLIHVLIAFIVVLLVLVIIIIIVLCKRRSIVSVDKTEGSNEQRETILTFHESKAGTSDVAAVGSRSKMHSTAHGQFRMKGQNYGKCKKKVRCRRCTKLQRTRKRLPTILDTILEEDVQLPKPWYLE